MDGRGSAINKACADNVEFPAYPLLPLFSLTAIKFPTHEKSSGDILDSNHNRAVRIALPRIARIMVTLYEIV
jgi:uncharacterized lipoprotein YbaY